MSVSKKIYNKLLYNRNDKTRFKLVMRNWAGVSDTNVLSRVLQTESFRSYMKQAVYEPSSEETYLVLAPHQDDELLGAGGLLLKAKSKRAHVSICYITNGAQKNLVLSGKKHTPEEVVKLRHREARSVCEALNADFLELGIDNLSMKVTEKHIDNMSKIIQDKNPTVILSPWVFDGSAKHRMVNHLLYLALRKLDLSSTPDIMGYQTNNPIFSNIVVDISGQIEKRSELLNLYKSQNLGIKNYAHLAEGLSAWNSRFIPSKTAQGKKQYAEIFMSVSQDEFKGLIEKYYLGNSMEIYFGIRKLARNMDALTGQ